MPELDWQKSSLCGTGDSCVHVAVTHEAVHIAESADPGEAVLTTGREAFHAFLRALKEEPVG